MDYYEIMKSKKYKIIVWLILLFIVHLVFKPIDYLNQHYFEVKKIDLPEYVKEIQKIKSSNTNYYIGHVHANENIDKLIIDVKDSIMEYFELKNITEYTFEDSNSTLKISMPKLNADQIGNNKAVEFLRYNRLGTLRNTMRLVPDTHKILLDNIDKGYKPENWNLKENKEVIFYIIFNEDAPKDILSLINKLDNADLSKIFLKFRFILVWIILGFLLINITLYLNAKIKVIREKNIGKKFYKERAKHYKKINKILEEQKDILYEIETNIYINRAKVEEIINKNNLKDIQFKLNAIPELIIKEININEKYAFYKKSLESLSRYKHYINKEDESYIKGSIQNAYNIFTNEDDSKYVIFQVLKEILLSKNIDVPRIIQQLSKEIDKLNSMIIQAENEYKNELHIISLGLKGEERVIDELNMYGDNFKIINNIRVQYDDMAVEIDCIVISTNGIYLLEVKNLGESGRYSIKISSDGRWSKIIGNREEVMNNITQQQNRHIAVIQKIVNSALKKRHGEQMQYIYANPIIVIANDNLDINNMSDVPILRISNLYRYIIKNKNAELSNDDIQYIINSIEEHRIPLKNYPVNNYITSIKAKYNNLTEVQDKLLTLNNIIVELKNYYETEYKDQLREIEKLSKQIENDRIYLLSQTFNSINKPVKTKVDIQYIGIKEA